MDGIYLIWNNVTDTVASTVRLIYFFFSEMKQLLLRCSTKLVNSYEFGNEKQNPAEMEKQTNLNVSEFSD